MFRRNQAFWKLAAMLLVLVLIVPVLEACGDDDDDETIPMTSQTTSIQPTSAQPTTTTSDEPVKIGVIASWTGAVGSAGPGVADPAMEITEYIIEQTGGILGGRPVEFVAYDDGSEVSGIVSGYTKLALQDKVYPP